MKILISSALLFSTLESFRTRKISVSHWLFIDDDLIFLNDDEQIISLRITKTLYCPAPKEMPTPFMIPQWDNIRKALEHFPEQPIVMKFEDDKIAICECELWFDNNGRTQR